MRSIWPVLRHLAVAELAQQRLRVAQRRRVVRLHRLAHLDERVHRPVGADALDPGLGERRARRPAVGAPARRALALRADGLAQPRLELDERVARQLGALSQHRF